MAKWVSDELTDEVLGIDLNCINGTAGAYFTGKGKKPLLKHYARLAKMLAAISDQLTSVYVLVEGVGFARLVCETGGDCKVVQPGPSSGVTDKICSGPSKSGRNSCYS